MNDSVYVNRVILEKIMTTEEVVKKHKYLISIIKIFELEEELMSFVQDVIENDGL